MYSLSALGIVGWYESLIEDLNEREYVLLEDFCQYFMMLLVCLEKTHVCIASGPDK